MTVVAVGSVKGAPGATTLALLAAATWPGPVVLVEADPDGGSLAARLGAVPDPGLSSLGAATRNAPTADLAEHSQRFGPLDVVLGPRSAERARAALTSGAHLAGALSTGPPDAVVDCGRLSPASPALPIAAAAAAVVCVCRPALDELQHVSSRVAALEGLGAQVGLVLVGERPYSASDVVEALGVAVVGVLPDDPASAAAAGAGRIDDPAVARSRLVRAATDIARRLHERAAEHAGAPA